MSEVIEMQKRAVSLNPQRIGLAEHMTQHWVINAEEGTTIDDVLDPAYWQHTAKLLQIYDRIDVRIDTGEWFLELIVTGVGKVYAFVHLAHKHILVQPTEESTTSTKHKVVYKGQHLKYIVMRVADNVTLQSGMSKAEAQGWLENYEKVTA
jgi:hypothetical protein